MSNDNNQVPSKKLSGLDEFEERISGLINKGRWRGKVYSVVGIIGALVIGTVFMLGFNHFAKELDSITAEVDMASKENLGMAWKAADRGLSIPGAWRDCTRNEDCAETSRSCCNCMAGGEQDAINRGHIIDWKEFLSRNCGNRTCSEAINCNEGQAVCLDGECEYVVDWRNSNCVSKGGILPEMPLPDRATSTRAGCCPGLKQVPVYDYVDGECSFMTDVSVCVDCPNGICEEGENICNCPDDCGESAGIGSLSVSHKDYFFERIPLRLKYPADWRISDIDNKQVRGISLNAPATSTVAIDMAASSSFFLDKKIFRDNGKEMHLDDKEFVRHMYAGTSTGQQVISAQNIDLSIRLTHNRSDAEEASSTLDNVLDSLVFLKADCVSGNCSDPVDTDGDGLPDWQELEYGTDPDKADTDGDGYTDKEEIDTGYNPLGLGKSDDY